MTWPRIAVFCSGHGSNFQAILDAVRKKRLKADIALMVCDNPAAFALRRAAKNNVPTLLLSPKIFPERKDYEQFLVHVLKSQKIDAVVLAGFMRILTPHFIQAYKGKILNIHPSLLPNFKGAHAIRDVFEARVKETGITVHLVTKDVDAGPILAQKEVKILKTDTLSSLETKIHKIEHQLYPASIQKFLSGRGY